MYIKQKKHELLGRADKEITEFILSIIKSKLTTRFAEYIDIRNISWITLEEWLNKADSKALPKPESDRLADTGLYLIRFKDRKSFALYIKYGDIEYIDRGEKIIEKMAKLYIIGPHRKQYKDKLFKYIEYVRTHRNINCRNLLSVGKIKQPSTYMNIRDMNTVCCNEEIKELLNNSLKSFFSNSDIYDNIGISHKLGIMLYGEPGTGKSSMIRALCTKIYTTKNKKSTRIINISMNDLLDDSVDLIQEIYTVTTTIIIIEDIDCITINREVDNNIEYKKALYKLLELLDGISVTAEMICIATTNHFDKLDTALTREGRFDIKIEMSKIDESLARKMCKNFRLTEDQTKEVLHDVEFPVNPSYLQNKILYNITK